MGSDHYERLFGAITPSATPDYLCEQVQGAVRQMRIRVMRLRLAAASLSTVASAAGLVFATPLLGAAVTRSGFASYASLALSDSSAVFGHFSTFLFSLIETLPSVEVMGTLLLAAVFLSSLRAFAGAVMGIRSSLTRTA